MKKTLLAAVAAGAMAAASGAMAQDLGSIIGGLFGMGTQQGVVVNNGTVYTDSYGRQFSYDQYGRQVYLQNQQAIVGYDQWGRAVYGTAQSTAQIVGYDSYGRAIYGTTPRASVYGANNYPQYGYGTGTRNDRDGDGVVNWQDRWPDDRRYW